MSEVSSFDALAKMCRREFSTMSDYIWKIPRLIEAEYRDELAKLSEYFPLNGDPDHDARAVELRKMRWRMEAHALKQVFPVLMATSNFFSSIALLETYLLMLCSMIEQNSSIKLSSTRGTGKSKCFNYLRRIGVEPCDFQFYEQVNVGFEFRNCLVHTSGLLKWYDRASEVLIAVNARAYLSRDHRERTGQTPDTSAEVYVQERPMGHQLVITNEYAWLTTGYFRDYFVSVCDCCCQVCTELQ